MEPGCRKGGEREEEGRGHRCLKVELSGLRLKKEHKAKKHARVTWAP
jgi:hypothetical protein